MRKYSFCSNWTCKHLGAPEMGAPVQIPHDAMLAEKRSELAASGINAAWFEGHDYLYENHFTPDAELADKKLVLELEGVYRKAEVSVNGEKLAFRPYGYTNFYVTAFAFAPFPLTLPRWRFLSRPPARARFS